MDVTWLRAEAVRQGLDLTDDDLVSIAQQLERSRRALAAARPAETLGLEPAYRFAARRSARHTRPDNP
jgi:hypothetical protein